MGNLFLFAPTARSRRVVFQTPMTHGKIRRFRRVMIETSWELPSQSRQTERSRHRARIFSLFSPSPAYRPHPSTHQSGAEAERRSRYQRAASFAAANRFSKRKSDSAQV